ncbi:hypothetical protein NQ318_013695 [Aromia moschata]|uniref:DUF4817 domain-containing protein n=1 Tax=Aromia moschata TaxID=1265417 RepID=A0AAV8Z821_9CUCU|nr:hypothetical protein NQ318_013695 [Aromia moschata]
MPLNERDRIEILMMIGVGDRMRTQQEVCRLFHEMHPDREPVSQSTVSRIERKYRELGHVRDAPRQGRPKINENVQQDVILSALENPYCTVRQVSRDLNIGKSSVSNIFKKVKYHPYRVRLIHELAEDDFDRRTEFCEYMMDHNNQNNGFIANILFSDEATMDEQLVQLDAIYDLPWNRIGPYLVGAITGYILIVRLQQKLTLTKKQKAFGWTVFPLLNIWILFTLYTRKISVEFSAVYMGVSRTLWGVGMAWVLIACCTGNAQALQKFLSFRGFIPLSRLTYCAYLLNPLVANMIYLGSESAFNASLGGFALTICGITLLTFYLSYLFSVMIESPMILLTKMAFKRITRRTNPRDKPQGEN